MTTLKHTPVLHFLVMLLCICCYFCWCKGCLDDERRAIQQILDSMGYQPESSSEEIDTDDCCQWEGVDCSLMNSHVVRLLLDDYREELPEIWFPDMNLFAQIKQLRELSLAGNSIGGLVRPEELCNLMNLELLDLSENMIEDDVHPCLANLSSLKNLVLSKNKFQGDLSFLSNLSKIEHIDVSYNHFQGQIQLSLFANLSRLSYLDLSYNYQLQVESESPNWHPTFQIQHLLLAKCNLHRLPSFLFTQQALNSVDLSNNFLEGPFPTWMLHNVSSSLFLRGNSFVGQFPNSQISLTLVDLDISCNHFDGQLPSDIHVLLPNLYRFNASLCQFTGLIPPSLGEMQNLQHLDLSNNHFSGFIPSGLTKDSALWYLNLSNNSLDGVLLPHRCNLTRLKWLLLHNNHFVGNIPICLSNSPSLKMLDVRHNNLSGMLIDQMPILSELGALLLRTNQFRGYIPDQLCQMHKLQFLDLSSNSFSGSIPSCLRNNLFWKTKFEANSWVPIDFTTKGNSYSYQGIPLRLMTGIDLSVNLLTDTIPIQLGELLELRALNLSHNHLIGQFPGSFKNLKNLESLDLSYNKLTGQVPFEIAQITSLTTFRVAFNDLSGKIPFFQQLTTFPESSFIGNPKLCGEPLPECHTVDKEDKNSDGHKENDGDDEEENHRLIDEPLLFYSFVFISYALGFWIVMAPLCFSRNWRRKYYKTIDRWMNPHSY